jgi:alkylation response protein AidB-like acyl-CoA dehydrogenase
MFRIEERDIRFNIFEYLNIDDILKFPVYAEMDKETVEMLLSNSFKVAKEVIAPINQPGDKEGVKIDKDGNVTVPEGYKQAYDSYCSDGWLGISSPPEVGGTGAPAVIGIAAAEASAAASISFAMYPGLTRSAASLILDEGTQEQIDMFVEKMLAGQWGGTMCITEPGAGSAVGDSRAMATPIKGDHYSVKGQKIFISSGDNDLVENTIHLVLARTPNAPVGIKGLSLFIVPKIRVNADGSLGEPNDVVCSGIEHKMGIKGSATCTMEFGENEKCEGWIVGNEGDGIRIMFHMMNEARLGVALLGLAVSGAAYNEALDYSRERIQGVDMRNFKDPNAPRVAIIEHPDVKRMLLTSRAYIHGLRALIYKIAICVDQAAHAEGEVKDKAQGMLDFLTPIAKGYGTDRAMDVTNNALQCFGGYGYVSEYPVEQYMRDARILPIYEGTNGIQSMDLVGRKLASKGGALFMNFVAELQAFLAKAKASDVTKDYIGEFEQSLNDLNRIAGVFMEKNMAGDVLYVLQYSVPFLKFMGNMVMSWLLGEQAMLAAEKLDAFCAEKGAKDDAARAALIKDNEEAAFLDAKLKTSRFFTVNLLPENRSLTQSMISNDTSVLDVVL